MVVHLPRGEATSPKALRRKPWSCSPGSPGFGVSGFTRGPHRSRATARSPDPGSPDEYSVFEKPPRMHWSTFERLRGGLDRAGSRQWTALEDEVVRPPKSPHRHQSFHPYLDVAPKPGLNFLSAIDLVHLLGRRPFPLRSTTRRLKDRIAHALPSSEFPPPPRPSTHHPRGAHDHRAGQAG